MSEKRQGNEIFSGAQSAPHKQNVMSEDFGFEVPVELVPLPSEGKVYPESSPLHNQKAVQIRAMTAREEDILTSAALIKEGTVLTELIRSCLVDKRIDPSMLIAGDRNALMVAIRITGYGADYKAETVCQRCDELVKQSFNLGALELKSLDVAPVTLGENLFEVTLPMSKKTVKFSFLTDRDENDMSQEQDVKRKKLGLKGESLVTDRLTRAVKSIENVSDKNKIATFVRNMPARDARFLRKFMSDNEPGINMRGPFKCTNPRCGHESEVSIPIGASFFWPDE